MKENFLYRGINARMYRESNEELKSKGTKIEAELYPSEFLVPSKTLMPGKSKQNAMDKHQHPQRRHEADFINNSAYLSTTPIYDVAKKYATNNNTEVGYIFIIDRTKLVNYNVEECSVSTIANIIAVPEDKEVLLLPTPYGERLNPDVIFDIIEVKPNNL